MEIRLDNINEIFSSLDSIKGNNIYDVELNCIYDAGLNPREIDIKYAEEISLTIPPIVVGIIKESKIKKFAIIDGNHRYYNRSQVEKTETIPAFIKIYENEREAFVDAYKANLDHGRRLSDRDELKGIQRIIEYLKKEDPNTAYTKIGEVVNLSVQRVSEYISWIEVNKVLGKDIVKWKAQRLAFMLKKNDNGKTLKEFWELNSTLSKSDLLQAIKYFKTENKIVDYKIVKIKNILESEDFDDGLRIKKDEKLSSLSTIINEDKHIYEMEEKIKENRFSDLKDSPNITNNLLSTSIKLDNEDEYNLSVNNEKDIIEEYSIEENIPKQYIPLGKNKDLIVLEGYSRFYKFETIARRYFENITEEVLTNTKEFKNLVNNNINTENIDSYNKLKPELRGMVKNIEAILKELVEFIEQ